MHSPSVRVVFLGTLFSLLAFASITANTVAAANPVLFLSKDGSPLRGTTIPPVDRLLTVCEAEQQPLLEMNLYSYEQDVTLADLYLVTVEQDESGNLRPTDVFDPSVEEYSLTWAGGEVTTIPKDGLLHFTFPEGLVVQETNEADLTLSLSVRFSEQFDLNTINTPFMLASVNELNPSIAQELTGTEKGIKVLAHALEEEAINISTHLSSDVFHFIKTRPHIQIWQKNKGVLYPGMQQELLFVDVTADQCGDVQLSRLSFEFLVENAFLGDISLYNDEPYYMPTRLNNRRGNVNEQLAVGVVHEVISLDLGPSEVLPKIGHIPAGETRSFVLRGDVVPLTSERYSISSRLATEAEKSLEWTSESSRSARALWRYSTENGEQHWMSGSLLPELLTDYAVASLPTGALEDSPFYRLLRQILLKMRPDEKG